MKRARSEPPRWRKPSVARKWRRGLGPRSRRPKGRLSFWARGRKLLWSWWPWSVLCVFALVTDRWYWAIVTGLMGLISYLITPSEFPPRYGLDHELSVGDDEFVQTVVGGAGVPFRARNSLVLLNNGDEFYPAMLEDIGKAQSSITIEAYIYWSGQIGLTFARALAVKAKAGVKVKILLDAIGSASIGEEILQTLKDGQCELAWYNPIHWYSLGRFNHRTHRKSLIVDGRVGFTGGAGIADHWLGNAEDPKHWRDIQIRVEGSAVVPLQTGFAQNWLQTTHELISGPLYFPAPVPAGSLNVQTIMSSPEAGASSVRILYYLSIICARRSIFIANPYFIPDQSAIDILIEAKRRGVDVRIMVSGINNDNWLARHNSVRLFRRVLEAGIEIHEYNRTMLHHKTMVVDNIWATVGTTNFDNRSFAHNEETNICVYDREVARVLRQVFMADLEACVRVELRTWRRRGLWAKTQEVIASVLQEQI